MDNLFLVGFLGVSQKKEKAQRYGSSACCNLRKHTQIKKTPANKENIFT